MIPYSEWKAKRGISKLKSIDQDREIALENISSETVKNMNSDKPEFDPSQLNYCISLLNNKYTSMSRFEK